MPIDFRRVPSKVIVPARPQSAVLLWVALFIVIVGTGAALAIHLWPPGRPTNTLWFWLRVVGYPVLAWAFLWSAAMASAYARRSEAMAINHVSDGVELDCHARASQPLAILAQAWCFSADETENAAASVAEGRVAMTARPSAAFPGADVTARWIAIPDRPFYAGNMLSEHVRHEVISDWLLDRLLQPVIATLKALPARTRLRVRLVCASSTEIGDVNNCLEAKLRAHLPSLSVGVGADPAGLSLFEVDAWADNLPADAVQLLVALQLRRAVSQHLDEGVTEAGAALLVGRLEPKQSGSALGSALYLHRPARGEAQSASEVVALATRWGQAGAQQRPIVWDQGLSDVVVTQLKSASAVSDAARWVDIAKTVGNGGHAGPWLATALAAEYAAQSGVPQVVIAQEGDQCVALVCRKPS